MRPTSRLPYALSLRLTELQYRHLVAQATLHGIGVSEAARAAIDRAIEEAPDLEGDVEMTYASLLLALDLESSAEQLREAGLA